MLPDSKTGAKVVYLNRQAANVIAGLPNRESTGLLLASFRNPDKPITLGIHWSKIRNRAALPDVRPHDLRHSFASVTIDDNVSLMVIGKLLPADVAHIKHDVKTTSANNTASQTPQRAQQ